MTPRIAPNYTSLTPKQVGFLCDIDTLATHTAVARIHTQQQQSCHKQNTEESMLSDTVYSCYLLIDLYLEWTYGRQTPIQSYITEKN